MVHNNQCEISKLAIQKEQEINNYRAEAGNLFKLSENQKQKEIDEARSMADTLVKLSEIETSLSQQEAGIRVKNTETKSLLAEQAACKALRDDQSWTSTRLTTMSTSSKKKDTKLAGVRWEFSEKEVEVAVAKKKDVQHENCADQIEAVARRHKEEIV